MMKEPCVTQKAAKKNKGDTDVDDDIKCKNL